jgi:hypothetical protein
VRINPFVKKLRSLGKAHVSPYRSTEYLEVHPCAKSFKARSSVLFKIDGKLHTHPECERKADAAAWRTIVASKSTDSFQCVAMWYNKKKSRDKLSSNERLDTNRDRVRLGECFIFQQRELKNAPHYSTVSPKSIIVIHRPREAWAHPCESGLKFASTQSIWYTSWYQMSYNDCKEKPNAGAFQNRYTCSVFPGPRMPQDPTALGTCSVLDKIPS